MAADDLLAILLSYLRSQRIPFTTTIQCKRNKAKKEIKKEIKKKTKAENDVWETVAVTNQLKSRRVWLSPEFVGALRPYRDESLSLPENVSLQNNVADMKKVYSKLGMRFRIRLTRLHRFAVPDR